MSLSASVLLSLLVNETDTGDISREVRTTAFEYFLPLTNGTGVNQATLAWSTAGEVDPLEDSYLNDAGFVFDDDERGLVTFTAIKVVYLKNTGTGNIEWYGGERPNGPTSGGNLTITPGGLFVIVAPDAAGWPTAGSTFALTNPTAAVQSYDFLLIGEGTIT